MAAKHQSDTTQCRTAVKLATWTLEVSVSKNGRNWKTASRKKASTNNWLRITKTPMGRRDGKVRRVSVQVSSWLSCFIFFRMRFLWRNAPCPSNPSQQTYISYSECVGIIMVNPTHYESDTCLNKFAQKWPKRMFQIFSTVQMQTWSHAAIFCHSFHSGLRHYPSKFGLKMVELFDRLIGSSSGMPANPTWFPPACSTFSSMNWDDLWHEAHMTQVCHYLRAGKDLKVPEEFRNHLPHKL